MKTRPTTFRDLAIRKTQRIGSGILFALLALAPAIGKAEGTPKHSNVSQAQPAAPAVAPFSILKDVKFTPEAGGKMTVTVLADRITKPNEFSLSDPPRLVLDFPNTENRVRFMQLPLHAASVKQLRIQQFQTEPSKIARIVFDLEDSDGKHEITLDKDSVRITFSTKPAPGAISNSASSKPAPTPMGKMPKGSAVPSVPPRLGSAKAADSATAQKKISAEPLSKASLSASKSGTPNLKRAAASTPSRSEAKETAGKSKALPEVLPQPEGLSQQPKAAQASLPTHSEPSKTVASSPRLSDPARQPKLAEAYIKDVKPTAPLVAALAPSALSVPPKTMAPANSRFVGQPLTLDLINIPLVDFFRLLAEEGGINIVMDPEVKGNISIKVVKVPWDQIFEAALANNGLDKQVEGTLVRIARKSTLQDEARQRESLKKATLLAADLETRIKRLNYTKADTMVKALADQKTVRGTVVVDERTNSLILTDLPSSLDKLTQLINTLDVPQPQVEIEARIVSATRDFARDIGIQFGFVDGNLQRVTVGGPNTFGTIGGNRPSSTATTTFAAGNPTTGRGSSQSTSSLTGGTSATQTGNWNVNLPANQAFGGMGISIGNIFDTFLLDAAITAGESKGQAKLISQPKVTAQNNSPAVITQGLRFPVQVVANNTVTVQFENAALTLTVTPQITYEGNIVLDLKIENNTPDFSNEVGGIPSIRTSESTTRVLVSDGGTTVIGGILMDDESTQEDKVPGLGSLPLVGNLFRRSSVSRSTQEVLFFVTPRIIK